MKASRKIGVIVLAGVAMLMPSQVALAASSTMNSNQNVNYVPGSPGYFAVDKGTSVRMNCWTRGPLAMGQYKWFNITVMSGPRYGLAGYVPAPSVNNQTTTPLCPPW